MKHEYSGDNVGCSTVAAMGIKGKKPGTFKITYTYDIKFVVSYAKRKYSSDERSCFFL